MLVVDKKKYMIGLISRLTDQKGLDLVNYCIERLVDDNTQLVVIGTGEASTRICSVTLHGNTRTEYPQTSVIPRIWLTSYTQRQMPF